VLFVVPYPLGKAPSQRFRVEQFLTVLDKAGISYKVVPFLDDKTGAIIYKPGKVLQKAVGTLMGYFRRLKLVLTEAGKYDFVFIHREAAPLGPPMFEWMLAKVLGKKFVFDFDDAIWIPNTSKENAIADGLKCFWKTGSICKMAYRVAGGNRFLMNYANGNRSGGDAVFLPTVVDMERKYSPTKEIGHGKPTVGWTGSHSTLHYLDKVMPALAKLEKEVPFTFVLIADKTKELPLGDVRFYPWNPTSEIDDLLRIDIGIMPLEADPWSEGKCGFKLIQYLSLGIPAVASPVGVNGDIIRVGENGYLAATEEEWIAHLRLLLEDVALRKRLGLQGKEDMKRTYSISSQEQTFINLFT
jgi:glycosyltransferase involved in cell wall biosynthesis